MKAIHIKLFLAIALFSNYYFAQDIHFSQYSETPSSINPALVGVSFDTRATFNFKNQYTLDGLGSQYQTFGLSFEQTIKHKKFKDNYFAVSANIYKDGSGRMGDAADILLQSRISTINSNLGITYLQKINNTMKISGGLQSGVFYRQIDLTGLKWGEQYNGNAYDASLNSGEVNRPRSEITSFDIGGGINLNYLQSDKFLSAKNAAKFDVGISAYHFKLGQSSFISSTEKLDTKVCAYFNGDFNIPNSRNAIMPSFLYMRQGANSEFIVGALFKFILSDPSTYTANKKPLALSIGGFYRYNDAILPSVLFQLDKYAIGISYDFNISSLTPATNLRGGLEFMLRYNIFPNYGVNLGRTDAKPSY